MAIPSQMTALGTRLATRQSVFICALALCGSHRHEGRYALTDRCPWCGQPARMEFVCGHYECSTCLIQGALSGVLFERLTVLGPRLIGHGEFPSNRSSSVSMADWRRAQRDPTWSPSNE